MSKNLLKQASLFIILIASASYTFAQTNLLQNPTADDGTQSWRAYREATVEEIDGNRRFVLRNGSHFIQDVSLTGDLTGQFAVFIGRASSESAGQRVTGSPYLSGYMMNAGDPSGGRIYAYLGGQRMSSRTSAPGEWTGLWGIFRIPPGTRRIRFFLMQAQRRDEPHDNSAARFDDLGLYIFSTEEAARNFVGRATGDDTSRVRIENNVSLSRCALTLAQSPEMYGLRLGMSLEEALNLFPGSREDQSVSREIERTVRVFGHVSLMFDADRHHSAASLPNVKEFWLRFFDDRLYALNVEYNNPRWNHVDEFINALPQASNLPPSHTWQAVGGIRSKYLICNNFEFRVFASHDGASDYVSLTDLVAERTLTARRVRARE